jgi:myo-inositol-1(or 4)-monophosphatase
MPAVDAARAGGAKLMEGLARPMEVTMKSTRANIVTWADEASQAAIVELLLRRYPTHAVMGEEGFAGNADGPYTWIVDPLDGTSNYARGLSPWGVSIGVRETGGPLVAGVIYDPLRDEVYAADREGNRTVPVGQTLAVSDTADLKRSLIATGLQNDDPVKIHEYVLRVEQLHLHARGARGIGCPAMVLAYIATGRLDAFVEKDATYAWDIAAGMVLIEEAGGRVTEFGGGEVNMGEGLCDVVASNGTIHDDLVDVVNMRRAGVTS